MRINYENYPILKKLHDRTLGVMPIFESDKAFIGTMSEKFTKTWKEYAEDFNTKIYAISPVFMEAKEKAQSKLMGIWSDIMNNDIADFEVKGTFLIGNYVYMASYITKQGSQNNEMCFYCFDKQGIPLFYYHDSDSKNIPQTGWLSQIFSASRDKKSAEELIHWHIANVTLVSMFATYAEVETKELLPRIKIKDSTGKYLNETSKNITYLDSKWFTTLVKSDGFLVSGHFRLQPKKKDGVWTKELIWIESFEKEGYTAPARKLTQQQS
jgi:hypothetical protein